MKKAVRIVFLNQYEEPRSGWIVTASIILTLLGQMTAGALVPDPGADTPMLLKLLVTGIYSFIMIGGGMALFKLVYKKKLYETGLVRKHWLRYMMFGLAAGLILMSIALAGLILCGQAQITGVDTGRLFSLSLGVEFVSLCLTAFAEEYLFRGLIMTALKTTRNKKVVFLTSAVIFSLIHLLNPGATILSFINTFLGGLLFAYMFIQSGSLWLPVGFHVAWNFLQGDIFGFPVSGNIEQSVFTLSLGKLDVLTGGSYGVEGGLWATFVLLAGFFLVRFLVKPLGKDGWMMK